MQQLYLKAPAYTAIPACHRHNLPLGESALTEMHSQFETDWKVGRRVSRTDTEAIGTIVAIVFGQIKVKWDSGRTSYYEMGEHTNGRGQVQLIRATTQP